MMNQNIWANSARSSSSYGLKYSAVGMTCKITGLGTCTDTDIVIPRKIDGYYVTAIDNWAFCRCANLRSVVISDTVTEIGHNAFDGCTALSDVTFGSSVTKIGWEAFIGCVSLTVVVIPDSVKTIGGSAFKECTSLEHMMIPDSVTSIGSDAFYGCAALSDVVIGNFVTEIGERTFQGCAALSDVVIGSSVTNIKRSAFGLCTSLDNVVIPDSVKTVGEMAFYGCRNVQKVWLGHSVETIGQNAFAGCHLVEIAIPSSVKEIGDGTFSFTSISPTVEYSGTEEQWNRIRKTPFWGLSLNPFDLMMSPFPRPSFVTDIWFNRPIPTVRISKAWRYRIHDDGKTCTVMGQACRRDCELVLPDSVDGYTVTAIESDMFQSGFNKNLTSAVIPDSVTEIGFNAFNGCTGLASIVIPDSVTKIGSFAFKGCAGLASAAIPDSVTKIDSYAFDGCTGLTSVWIPDSVTEIGNKVFDGCPRLSSVSYGGTKEQWARIKKDEFDKAVTYNVPNPDKSVSRGLSYRANTDGKTCTVTGQGNCKDKEIRIPKRIKGLCVTGIETAKTKKGFFGLTVATSGFDGDITRVVLPNTVTAIGKNAFRDCTRLKSVEIPDSVTEIGENAFMECASLTGIVIPDSVKTVGTWAFKGCTSLSSALIGNSVTVIGESMFMSCAKLKSIEIPESVKSIEESAFKYCASLASVTVPNSVRSIGKGAFKECTSLAGFEISESVEKIGEEAFCGCTALTRVTFHETLSKEQTGWGVALCITALTEIGKGAFKGCTSLVDFVLSESVKSIGEEAFSGCACVNLGYSEAALGKKAFAGVAKLMVSDGNRRYAGIDGNLYSKDKKSLLQCTAVKTRTEFTVPDFVTYIGSFAFAGCAELSVVCFGGTEEQWNRIRKAPDWKTDSGIQTFRFTDAMGQKSKTPSARISWRLAYRINEDGETCTVTGQGDCKDKALMIPGMLDGYRVSAIAKEQDENGTFISGFDEDITHVSIPSTVTRIGKEMFCGCKSLMSVEIPDSVTDIGAGAFANVGRVEVSDSNPRYVTVDGDLYSKDMTVLLHYDVNKQADSFTIPDSVKTVGADAFLGCEHLTEAVIPSSVVRIESSAFYGCKKLEKLRYEGSKKQWLNVITGSSWMSWSGITHVKCKFGKVKIE